MKSVSAKLSRFLCFGFRVISLLGWLTLVATAQAQDAGSVAGSVVSSWDGSPLPLVTITVRGTTLAAQTDAAGRYELKGVPAGTQVLRFSKAGFSPVTVTDVRVLPGQTSPVNGNLRPDFFELEEFQVTAEEFNEQSEKILFERQHSSAMIHAMGSEQFSKLGSSSAAEVATKVSGTTIVDGKYAVVRGLNDRYVPTTLNGAYVPAADPYRRAASLDQFPAGMIDQVAITKTFTPDQPGDATGGGVNVVTKQVPKEDFLDFKVGLGYNSQATGNKDFLTYKGGETDWLGMDDGTRNLPGAVGKKQSVPPARTITPRPTSPDYQSQVDEANLLNKQTVAMGTTQFRPTTAAPPPDQKMATYVGKVYKVADQKVGFVGGVDYKREYRFDGEGEQQRIQGTKTVTSQYDDARSLTTVAWAAMGGVGAELWEEHQIGFNILFSQTARDTARIQSGTNYSSAPDRLTVQDKLQWIEQNLTTYQLVGKSRFTALNDLELDYLLAKNSSSQDQPDTRFFNYIVDGTNGQTGGNFIPDPSNPTRYYSGLTEDSTQAKVDLTLPFDQWGGHEAKLKGGFSTISSDRLFWERNIFYRGQAPWTGGDPNDYLTEDNLGYDPTSATFGRTRWNWQRYITAYSSDYTGSRDIDAVYLMTDFPIVEKLRVVGGVRVEDTDIKIRTTSFLPSSITGEYVNNTQLQQTDYLPSVGLIWTVMENMNVRVNYSQTVARPSFRELASYRSYDPNLDTELEGNPNLVMSSSDNYDIAWEWFPRPSSMVGVGAFYKRLSKPIEQSFITLDASIMSWNNRESATVMGMEFEGRQQLDVLSSELKYFSLGGNFSLINSETDLTKQEKTIKAQYVPGFSSTRPLSEQSPYIINVDCTFDHPRLGTVVSLIYNIAGPRLIASALTTEDIYEQPFEQLDLIASQRLAKNFYLKLAVKNLLNPARQLTYGDSGGSQTYSSYRVGTTYSIGLDLKF